MQDSITFNASKKKAALMFVGSLLFVAGGIAMIEDRPLVGWSAAVFFGLCAVASIMTLLPNSICLRLDESGYEMRTFRKGHKVLWNEVASFRIGSIKGAKMIEVIYSHEYQKGKIARALASTVSGMEGAIANSYDAPLDEILAALNSWKARFEKNRQ